MTLTKLLLSELHDSALFGIEKQARAEICARMLGSLNQGRLNSFPLKWPLSEPRFSHARGDYSISLGFVKTISLEDGSKVLLLVDSLEDQLAYQELHSADWHMIRHAYDSLNEYIAKNAAHKPK